MTEDDLVLTQEKARRAKEILESEIMGEMFAHVEKKAVETAISMPPGDHEGRLHALLKVRIIRELAQELGSMVAAGMSAARKPPKL